MPIKRGIKPLAQNRKARHDYFIEDTLECGIELCGTEVKSLRKGQCNLKDSYAQVKNGELFVIGMHISPYEQGNIFNRDPFRTRKLLAHKSEIKRLAASSQQDGMSLIPLQIYLKDGRVKMEVAVAKGKKLYDKRHSIAERGRGARDGTTLKGGQSMRALPFSKEELEAIVQKYPTPFHIYDEAGIRNNVLRLQEAFAWNNGFREYFAVKALPNPAIMKLLHSIGCGMDCSSLTELLLSRAVGITGTDIMFSSNDTPAEEFRLAREMEVLINLDDITHIPFLADNGGIPNVISCRFNPGGEFMLGNTISGQPRRGEVRLYARAAFGRIPFAQERGRGALRPARVLSQQHDRRTTTIRRWHGSSLKPPSSSMRKPARWSP